MTLHFVSAEYAQALKDRITDLERRNSNLRFRLRSVEDRLFRVLGVVDRTILYAAAALRDTSLSRSALRDGSARQDDDIAKVLIRPAYGGSLTGPEAKPPIKGARALALESLDRLEDVLRIHALAWARAEEHPNAIKALDDNWPEWREEG